MVKFRRRLTDFLARLLPLLGAVASKLVVCLINIFFISLWPTLPLALPHCTTVSDRACRRQRCASERSQVAGKISFSLLMHAREAHIQQQRTAMRKALILLCMLTHNTRDTYIYALLQYHTYDYMQYLFYKIYSTCTGISIKVHQYSHTTRGIKSLRVTPCCCR